MTEEKRAPRYYRRAKPKRQRRREVREGIDQIVWLHNEGRTPKAIAASLPVSTQAVETILAELEASQLRGEGVNGR